MIDQSISNSNQQKSKRLIELDSLRGIACLSILLFHFTSYYNDGWQHSQEPLILFKYGNYGVELFFLISGFSIFMSLKNKSVQEFAILRFWRLFPTYWIAIITIFFVGQIVVLSPDFIAHGNVSLLELIANFTMIPNVFSLRYVDSSHWFLGFVLLFYVNIAIIFWVSRSREYFVLIALLSWTMLAVIWHSFLQHFHMGFWMAALWHENMLYWQYIVTMLFILPYINLFLIGVAFYLLYEKRRLGLAIFSIIFGVMSDFFIWNRELSIAVEHSAAVIVVVLIFYLALFLRPAFLTNKILVYFGSISYSLYLIHQKIGLIIIQQLEKIGINSNIAILIAIVSVIILANFLYFLIEKPSYKLIKSRLAINTSRLSQK
jgi:peptidoglycan/LPS O-acetylase OafA/YrhL